MTGRPAYQHLESDYGEYNNGDIGLEQYHEQIHESRDASIGNHVTDADAHHFAHSYANESWSRENARDHEPIADEKFHTGLKGWTPFYLRRATILTFVLFELGILVGLVLLYEFDRRNDGLATADSSQHLLWTYGPTAVLALVAAFWSQVEHRTRQMEPWHRLAQRPSPAAQTLLMDYVSIAQPLALFRSLKNRHWTVAFSILASILIKLLTILSTGLLMLQYVGRSYENVALLATDRFDSSAWKVDMTDFADNAMPIMAAIAVNSYGLPYRTGISENYTIPSLSLNDTRLGPDGVTIDVALDAFNAELDCEPAAVSLYTNPQCVNNTHSDCWLVPVNLHIEAASCVVDDFGWLDKFLVISADTFFGQTTNVNCTNLPEGQNINRTLIISGLLKGDESSGIWVPNRIERSTGLLCEVKAGTTPVLATVDAAGNLVKVVPSAPKSGFRDVGNVTTYDIDTRLKLGLTDSANPLMGVLSTLNGVVAMYSATNISYDNHVYALDFDYFFETVGASAKPTTLDFFLNQESILQESTRVYSQMAAQLAKQHLMASTTTNASGNGLVIESRLRVRGLSLYWMFGTVATLILVTGALFFMLPQRVVSRDPGSIGGLATIVARSQGLRNALERPGIPSKASIRKLVTGKYCSTTVVSDQGGTEFKIDMFSGPDDEKHDLPGESLGPERHDSVLEWWRPWALLPATKISIMVYLTALIAVLAGLNSMSWQNDGLEFVETSDYTRYTWVYIPALVMIIVQQLIDAISFASKIVLPYHELRHWPSNARHTIFNDQTSRLSVQSLYDSITWQHWGITATSLAMILAPFLTVIAGGLYSTELVQYPTAVNLTSKSVFNSSFYSNPDIGLSSGAAYLIDMIYAQNLSYPAWTYRDLAFDQISIPGVENTSMTEAANLTTRLPAVRAGLSCNLLAPSALNITRMYPDVEGMAQIQVQWKNPADASQCAQNKTRVSIPTDHYTPFGYTEWLYYYVHQANCPRFVAIYGRVNDSSSPLNVLACQVPIQQVEVDATFSLPDYTVTAAVPDEATTTSFTDIGSEWANDFWNIGLTNLNPINNTGNASLNPVFETLYAWYPTLTVEDLIPSASAAEATSQKIAAAFSGFTGTLHAQYINLAGRIPPSGNLTQSRFITDGTLTQPGRMRLQQSDVSTRLLISLLAVIFLCVALSFWSMNTKEILPVNPCSIGAAASLLAGSEMLQGIPAGAELVHDDGEVVRMGVFAGGLFSMGWWGEDWSVARFGIDVGKSGG